MPFTALDTASITRSLSQLADFSSDLADAYFERLEVIELPPAGEAPGLRVRRELGMAVRLMRDGRTWLAGRDSIDSETFADMTRRVARALPAVSYPRPNLGQHRFDEAPDAPEVLEFPSRLNRAVRAQHEAGSIRVTVRRHRRWLRVVGLQVSSDTESESFYSVVVETDGGKIGGLYTALDDGVAEQLAGRIARTRQATSAEPPKSETQACVLGSGAAAVLLHEAVAHALEADVLARGGHPEAAIGVELGSSLLNVFDDPVNAPEGVRRRADDEGYPTTRRCLLRAGVVEQPICDALWSRRSDLLLPGGGRRGDRHDAPGPRSTHLELVPGETDSRQLFADADGGLFFPEAVRGHLDVQTGHFELHLPYGLRIQDQAPGPMVGASVVRGHVSDLLKSVVAIGRQAKPAGAGWCAKDGIRMPVWATSPDLRLEAVEVSS